MLRVNLRGDRATSPFIARSLLSFFMMQSVLLRDACAWSDATVRFYRNSMMASGRRLNGGIYDSQRRKISILGVKERDACLHVLTQILITNKAIHIL